MVKHSGISSASEQGKPARDSDGLHVTPIFGRSGVEQGLAASDDLRNARPFRRDVVDRMLKAQVGDSWLTLENLGQIADGLGLNAVLMSLPSAHLGRLSLPAALELPESEGLVLVTGSANGRLRLLILVKASVGSVWKSSNKTSKYAVPLPSAVDPPLLLSGSILLTSFHSSSDIAAL